MPSAIGVAMTSAATDVTTVPKRKLPAPNWLWTGSQATCQMKLSPKVEIESRAPSIDLPGDQPDEHERAECGDPGDALQDQVAKTHPPPREGAAGCVSYVERGHDCSRFSPTTSGSS